MKPTLSPSSATIELSPSALATDCPLNHGLAVLDQLMAGLRPSSEAKALDLALELRFMLKESAPPEIVIETFCNLKAKIESTHYLACYRLRRYLEHRLHAIVRVDRQRPPLNLPVPLQHATIGCIRCACLESAPSADASPVAKVEFGYTARSAV